MLISICIPHYNRAEFLVKVLDTIQQQTYSDIEVIISDDCSSDDSGVVIPDYIKNASASGSRIGFKYIRQPKNLGYDGNLRASLEAGVGDYLFILGNDDGLNGKDAIHKLADHLEQFSYPEVVFCNSMEDGIENSTHFRTNVTGDFGKGPDVAVEMFRCFSFVAGIAYKREWFHRCNTDRFDGSVYVQIYLATKIIASGGRVSAIKDPLVVANIRVGDKKANSYVDFLKSKNSTIHEERGGLDRVFIVAYAGIRDNVDQKELNATIRRIYSQLYFYTYPLWLYMYRKDGVYKASVNLAIGCRPSVLINERLSLFNFLHSWVIYSAGSIAGLLLPVSFVDKFKDLFKRLSKRYTYKSA